MWRGLRQASFGRRVTQDLCPDSQFVSRRFGKRYFASTSSSNWIVDPQSGLVARRQKQNKSLSISEADASYQVIVGLEIHAQLDIPTKLFSPAPSAVQRRIQSTVPNTLLHPFDLAVPGFLPTLSKTAVQKAVLAAAALNCNIANVSRFERKHYAYADLPHSYQITQQRWPLAINGSIRCSMATTNKSHKLQTAGAASEISCRIERLQLECDTAKTTATSMRPGQRASSETPSSQSTWSLVDFTRAGTALIEIVTAPDLRSSAQATAIVTHIRQLLQHAQVCPGKMQEGHLRVDVNVNLQRLHNQQRNARVEVKNLNSIQQVAQAIDYEATRQAHEWSDDMSADHSTSSQPWGETRTWDVLEGRTKLIRKRMPPTTIAFCPNRTCRRLYSATLRLTECP